jgi:hypothetical protein
VIAFPPASISAVPFPGQIRSKLLEVMAAEGASLGQFDGPVATEPVLDQALREGTILSLCDDRASYGEFEELEKFLIRHRLHFDRHSDAFAQYSAEWALYRGRGRPLILPAG